MTSPSMDDLRAKYQVAEDAIKLYERLGLDNLASAVNELRYAGHHMLIASQEIDDQRKMDALTRALHHIERAKYDAKEATILKLLEGVAEFCDEGFSSSELDVVLPNWREMLAACVSAQRILEESGCVKNFEGEAADRAIEALMDARDALVTASADIGELRQKRALREEAVRKAAIEDAHRERTARELLREKREDRRHVQSVALAVLGIILSVVGLLATIV